MSYALKASSLPPVQVTEADLNTPAIRQLRIDLAASFRMAARLGMQEGVCNHFSAVLPGRDDLFLVNPFGHAFEELTASSLLVCDINGNVIAGDGMPEVTAYYIHARVHIKFPRARVVFHTHMPNATALSMLKGDPLRWAGQTALKFYGRTAVDSFNGLAHDTAEGDRIADALGDADVLFMKNHGIMVVGKTVADAWNDLYYLERACEVQRLAMSTGQPLDVVEPVLAARVYAQMRSGGGESARRHLESVKRILGKTQPDYAV